MRGCLCAVCTEKKLNVRGRCFSGTTSIYLSSHEKYKEWAKHSGCDGMSSDAACYLPLPKNKTNPTLCPFSAAASAAHAVPHEPFRLRPCDGAEPSEDQPKGRPSDLGLHARQLTPGTQVRIHTYSSTLNTPPALNAHHLRNLRHARIFSSHRMWQKQEGGYYIEVDSKTGTLL